MTTKKIDGNDRFTRRFYLLNVCVTVVLFAAIFISISQFGASAWRGKTIVAVVLPGERDTTGWNEMHYSALKSVCDESDAELLVRENVPPDYESCRNIAEGLSRHGVSKVVFVNGCRFDDISKFDRNFPRINFCTVENISILSPYGRYFVRAFRGFYLAGILAGLRTKTGKIGCVASRSNPEVNLCVNAFALGVQSVNPGAEVLLSRTGTGDTRLNETQAVQTLRAEHADVLVCQNYSEIIPSIADRAGINFISFNTPYPSLLRCLAAIKFDWKRIYGSFFKYTDNYADSRSLIAGVSSGSVTLETLGNLSSRERILLETARQRLGNGKLIFFGKIFDTEGVQRCGENETLSFRSMQNNMNWLVRGVRVVGI